MENAVERYIIGIINRAARRDSTLSRQSGQIAREQNWTVEIIATSADALVVNPRLWPAICHGELGAIRHGGFLPICNATRGSGSSGDGDGGAESFAFSPASVFSIPSCLLPGKYRELMCHQQIITRCRNHRYAAAAAVPTTIATVGPACRPAKREVFISPGNFRAHKDDTTGTTRCDAGVF